MQLLARLGGYREEVTTDAAPAGGLGAEFNPSEVKQGEGLFDKARELEKQQEENGGAEKTTTETVPEEKVEGKTTTEETKTDDTPFVYNGVEVTVANDPEVEALFNENKEKLGNLDINKVNRELFSEAGLTEPTKQKLYEVFGKASVDMYLKGWKAQNDAALAQNDAFSTQYQSMADDATGGKLTEVLKWANDNLKPGEYQDYAELVNSGNLKVARMALKELTTRSGLKASVEEKKSSARETGMKPNGLGADAADTSPINAAQYQQAIVSREYYKDPAGWDARRRAGQAQGI